MAETSEMVTIPAADYRRLLELVEFDYRLVICETCGAWIDRDDPAYCSAEDYEGCWESVTTRGSEGLCRKYRVTVLDAPSASPDPTTHSSPQGG